MSRVLTRRFLSLAFTCAALTLPFGAHAQLSGTFSVAPGGDYESLGAAVTALYAQGVNGPVIFEIAAGSWIENAGDALVIDLPSEIPGASATNGVTFTAAPGLLAEQVMLERSMGTTSNPSNQVAVIGSSFVTLRNLTLRTTDSNFGLNTLVTLIRVQAAAAQVNTGFTLEGCILDGHENRVMSAVRVTTNHVTQDMRIEGNRFVDLAQPIFLDNFGTSHNSPLIEDNDFSGMGSAGGSAIRVTGSFGLVIRGNRLDYFEAASDQAIFIGGGNDFLVEANRIFNIRQGTGPNADTIAIGISGPGGRVVDNMVSGFAPRGVLGISLASSVPVLVAHNSVHTWTGPDSRSFPAALIAGSGHTVLNNIFVVSDGRGSALKFSNSLETLNHTIESNLLYSEDWHLVDTASSDFDTIEAWQAEGFGAGSVSLLPEFADPDDLHLAGCSPADPELLGVSLADPALTTDFDGEPREPLIPRMGADQVTAATTTLFAPSEQYDIGAIPIDLAAGDFDGDLDLDIAVSRLGVGPGTIEILENAGDGTFTIGASVGVGSTTTSPTILRAGDIDNDGNVDLATILSQGTLPGDPNDRVRIYWGLGDGSFDGPLGANVIFQMPPLPDVLSPFDETVDDLELADLDGDDDLEILLNDVGIVGGIVPGHLYLLCLDQSHAQARAFQQAPVFDTSGSALGELPSNSIDLVTGDLDDDGDPETLTGPVTGPVTVHENESGTDGVCSLREFPTGVGPGEGESTALQPSTAAVLLDGDLFADLVYDGDDSLAQDSIFLQFGNGDLTFGAPVRLVVEARSERRPGPLVALDHEDDGDFDLFVGNRSVGGPEVDLPGRGVLLENDGDANFTQRLICGEVGLPRAPRKLIAADFNNDGRDDVGAVMWGSDAISVLLNTSFGIPAQLIENFAAELDGSVVALTWSTPSEEQNAGFGIERRADPAGAWSSIGIVAGAGTSETPTLYAFDDAAPASTPTGNLDYRLRQVGFDGSVQFTDPVTVVVGVSAICGDLDQSGAADIADVARYRQALSDPASPLTASELDRCSVIGLPDSCSIVDVAALIRALLGLPPGIAPVCPATP